MESYFSLHQTDPRLLKLSLRRGEHLSEAVRRDHDIIIASLPGPRHFWVHERCPSRNQNSCWPRKEANIVNHTEYGVSPPDAERISGSIHCIRTFLVLIWSWRVVLSGGLISDGILLLPFLMEFVQGNLWKYSLQHTFWSWFEAEELFYRVGLFLMEFYFHL